MRTVEELWISASHLGVAFAATLFLIVFHFLAPRLTAVFSDKGKAFASFSGGVAVAYVFLHMLPSLVEYNKPVGEFLLTNHWLTPLTELLIYLVAFFGFLIYFGLDVLAARYQQAESSFNFVYGLHLGMFGLYNFLITYTMALRAVSSMTATALFTLAMALHFILIDRKFSRSYSNQFDHKGRLLLIGALLAGWLTSVIFDPVNVLVVALMVAFLSGSVLLNVFREELPANKLLHYFWFVAGSLLIALILLIQTWLLKLQVF